MKCSKSCRRILPAAVVVSLAWSSVSQSLQGTASNFLAPPGLKSRKSWTCLQSPGRRKTCATVTAAREAATGNSFVLSSILACAFTIFVVLIPTAPSDAEINSSIDSIGSSVQRAKNVAEATLETIKIEGEQIVKDTKRNGIGKTVEKVTDAAGAALTTIKEEGIEKSVEKATNAAKARLESITEVARALNVEKSAIRELRGINDILNKMQADLYSESWMTLRIYPSILRAYIPLLTYYTDASCDSANNEASPAVNQVIKSAMTNQLNRMFRAVTDFEISVGNSQSVRDAERDFAFISLSYDEYCKLGRLYSGYNSEGISTPFTMEAEESQLKYKRLALAQPRARDEVFVIDGVDRGRQGRVIDLEEGPDGKPQVAVVKLDTDWRRGPLGDIASIQEVKTYPYVWIALRDTNLSLVQDFVAATLAAVISCGLTLPIDNMKVRQQAGLPAFPPAERFGELFAGLPSNLGQYCIPGGIFLSGSNLLANWAVALPFLDGNNPDLKLFFLIPAGVLANSLTMPIRVPFEEMNKLIQTGDVQSEIPAFKKVFLERSFNETYTNIATLCIIGLTRGIPFGALQVATYELFKDKLAGPYEAAGLPLQYEALAWGALAGAVTGYATNPPDVIMTRTVGSEKRVGSEEFDLGLILKRIETTTREIYEREGISAFNSGALERTVYLAIEACLWFASYEWLREVILALS